MWLGFCTKEVPPSPKDQTQLVGKLVDVSVNCTTSGLYPDPGDPTKSATGAATGMPPPPPGTVPTIPVLIGNDDSADTRTVPPRTELITGVMTWN